MTPSPVILLLTMICREPQPTKSPHPTWSWAGSLMTTKLPPILFLPRERTAPFHILYCREKRCEVVASSSQKPIAGVAEKTANPAGEVVVIDIQPVYFPTPVMAVWGPMADGAEPLLGREHRVVDLEGDPVLASEVVVELAIPVL